MPIESLYFLEKQSFLKFVNLGSSSSFSSLKCYLFLSHPVSAVIFHRRMPKAITAILLGGRPDTHCTVEYFLYSSVCNSNSCYQPLSHSVV